jgi:hypothetical protein
MPQELIGGRIAGLTNVLAFPSGKPQNIVNP